MNCRRVRKNLPLYVEGDLDRHTAAKIELHIEQCGRCNWLADEYKESQTWWRSDDLPKFDEARLGAIKSNVLAAIDEAAKHRSLLASLGAYFSRRYVFALATAMLILSTAVVLYLYQQRSNVDRISIALVDSTSDTNGSTDSANNAVNDTDSRRHSGGTKKQRNRPKIKTIRGSLTSKPSRDQDIHDERSVAATMFEAAPTLPLYTNSRRDPDVLRIEIQTSDPKIRIIWFAPKETDSHQSKPLQTRRSHGV